LASPGIGCDAVRVQVDFGRTSDDYARHRAGFPPSFFDELAQRGLLLAQRGSLEEGARALDLGTGTGTILRGLERRGVSTVGIDPSMQQLQAARDLARSEGVVARLVRARAEELPFADATFDLVCAGVCWHWLDGVSAAREVRRVLRRSAAGSSGALIVAGFDWLAHEGSVGEMTNDLVHAENPQWKPWISEDLAPGWIADLRAGGFEDLESFAFDVDVVYTHASWRGRIRACSGVGASLPPDRVLDFDRRFARALAERFPGDPLRILHRVFALIARG
jgi:SAM-dependent methyltransferase